MPPTPRFLPRWFNVWFWVSCAIFFVGGVINRLSGKATEGFDPGGAAIGVSAMYLFALLVWRKKGNVQTLVSRLPLPLMARSVLIGWFFAEVDELVNFPFNPLFPHATLVQDIVLTTPVYVLAHLGWFVILRNYHFTPAQSLMTGGLALGLFESFSGGFNALAIAGILIAFPFVVMIHGSHLVMPKLALTDDFARTATRETKWKYPLGVLFPSIGTSIGVGIAYLIAPLLA